jgi:hypothetical protein
MRMAVMIMMMSLTGSMFVPVMVIVSMVVRMGMSMVMIVRMGVVMMSHLLAAPTVVEQVDS